MYSCSICQKPVTVDHVNPPVYSCDCVGRTVNASISGALQGVGGVSEVQKTNTNLSDPSLMLIKSTMFAVLAAEFFKEAKSHIFLNNAIMEDTDTKRKFSFTITAQEL